MILNVLKVFIFPFWSKEAPLKIQQIFTRNVEIHISA